MCGKVTWILGLLVLGFWSVESSEMSCPEAVETLMPCRSFLVGTTSSITFPCCNAANAIGRAAASDRAELKTLCSCLKQVAAALGVNTDQAKQIPQLCGVPVSVPIDPNVNCDSL